jgi:hypothetical protein
MRLLPRTRPFRLLTLAVVAGLAVGGALLWRNARGSDPVSEREALAAFRERPGGAAPPGGPAPGVYTYRSSGSERGGVGPFAVSRRLPRTARLVVTAAPGGWEGEFSYSRQHIEGTRYVTAADGIRITWLRTDVTFAGFGSDDRRSVDPPSLFMPAGPAVGDAWKERYRTGDINVVDDNRIVRAERVRVGARSVQTLVVKIHSVTDGPHPGTRDEKMWWSPSLGLPVRSDVAMDIGGVFAFRATSSVSLTDPEPRR